MIAANSPGPEPGDEERGKDEIEGIGGEIPETIHGVEGQPPETTPDDMSESGDMAESEEKPDRRKGKRRDRPRGIDSLDKAIDEDKKTQHWHRWKISEAERRSVVLALLKIVRTKNAKISDKLKAVERLQEIDRLNVEAEKKGPPPVEGSATPIQDAVAELERKSVEIDGFARRILIAQVGQPGDVCLGQQRGKVDSGPASAEN